MICYFKGLKLNKTSIQRIIYNVGSIVIKTQNNSQISNSITHTYVNTIDYHYYIEMHCRKAKQQVSRHLNTNSRLLNFSKYKKTKSNTLCKIDY